MCLPLSHFQQLTDNFTFVTDTNLYKPLIWVPQLCASIINKAISKLL